MRNEFTPLVSVVIPTFNYAHFLAEAIESVLAQTYTNFEIIIVDNFSLDNTAELVGSFLDDRIKFLQFENKGSIAAARNFGWKNSSGELVAFLDADDSWYPMKLSSQVRLHVSNLAVSYHDLKLFGARRLGVAKGRWLRGNPTIQLLLGGNPIATSSVLLSRHLLDLSKGFPEALSVVSAEDLGLWLKLGDLGAGFAYLPRILGQYRIHHSSASKGRSANAAREVTHEYRSKLSVKQLKKLDGWLAYAFAVSELPRVEKKKLYLDAVRNASIRFKWRALFRLLLWG